jgi:Vinculin family
MHVHYEASGLFVGLVTQLVLILELRIMSNFHLSFSVFLHIVKRCYYCTLTASHYTEDLAREEMTDRAMMLALPEEDRIKIQQQVQLFRAEKAKLDREMAKWDDNGNDIIIIAKQMCMIMMEMTDFTRFVYICCATSWYCCETEGLAT